MKSCYHLLMTSEGFPKTGVTAPIPSGKVVTHETEEETAYWARFYEHHDFNNGSSFFDFVNNFPSIPDTVIDIGCGQGRDSFAFARAGKRVLGLDRSEVGVTHATNGATHESLGHSLSFEVCDVSHESELADKIAKIREISGDQPVCFYMRFFLHSIPEDVQNNLMELIASSARPGDTLAAEFRTDKDEEQSKTFGDTHYRRYQNADDFSKNLRETYGWQNTLFETEGRGLSPYGDEDPVLYRVIAARQ